MQRGHFNPTNFLPEVFKLYQINVEKNICQQKFNSKKITLNVMTWYKSSVTLTMFDTVYGLVCLLTELDTFYQM